MSIDIEELQVQCYADPVLFLRTFLPEWFPKPIPWFHRGTIAVLTRSVDWLLEYGELDLIERWFQYKVDPEDELSPSRPMFTILRDSRGLSAEIHLEITRNTNIMFPRGYSKTTLLNGVNIWTAVYATCPFVFYLSETATHAKGQLNNVKNELAGNELIQQVYGTQQGQGTWREDLIETAAGPVFACQGRGGQVRGKNIRGMRPHRIIGDDIEDEESVATEEQRAKTRDWFFRAVLPALPTMADDAGVVLLGTMLHTDCLIARLAKNPEWTTIKFGALLDDGTALWPEAMDEAAVERKKLSFQSVGQLSGFYLEFLNKVRLDEGALFRQEYFQYGVPAGELQKAIAVDPAISEAKGAALATITVTGMAPKGQMVVLEVWGKRGASPREIIDNYFILAKKWGVHKHGVESIAYQAALIHLMREEMFRRKYYFEIIPITHKQKKELRIQGILQPRYAAYYMWHARRFPELETQLLDWPNGGFDWADSEAMAVALLDPYAPSAAGDVDLAKDTMPPLDEVLGDWRFG